MSIVESASKCNCTRPMPKQGIAKSFAMEHTAFWILMIEDLGAQGMAKRTNDRMSYNNWHCCFVGRILIAVYAMRKFSRGCVHSLKYNPRPACAFYPRGNCSESQGRVNETNMSWEKASNQCVVVYLFGQWTESSLISNCLFGNAKVCLSRIVCSVVLKFIGRTVCLLVLKVRWSQTVCLLVLKFVGVGLLIQLCESSSVSSGLLCCAEFVSLELLFGYAKVRQSWNVCSAVQKLDTGGYAWIARSAFQWVAQGSYGVFMSNGQFRLQKNKSNTFPGTAPGLNQS